MSVKAVREKEVKLWGEDLWKRLVLSRKWKRERERAMDKQSGESEEEEVMVKGIGE